MKKYEIGDLARSTGEKHRIGVITKKSTYDYRISDGEKFAQAVWGTKTEIYVHWTDPEDNEDTSIRGWKYQDSPYLEALK